MSKEKDDRVIAEKQRSTHHSHTVINKQETELHSISQEGNLAAIEEVCNASDDVYESKEIADLSTRPSALGEHHKTQEGIETCEYNFKKQDIKIFGIYRF